MLEELEKIVNLFNIKIRYEKGDFLGGYCLLKDEKLILINKKIDEKKKINLLASLIYEFGLNKIDINCKIKNFIEDEVSKNKIV